MADEINISAEVDPELNDVEEQDFSVPNHINDWFLQELIELAEMGIEQSITLSIGGSHINGKLVGGDRYFENIARNFEDARFADGSSMLQETLVKLFKSHQDMYPKTAEDRPPLGTGQPNYIHLRDARWHSLDGKTMPGNGTFWRGKVSSVDGFMLGELRVEQN